MDSKEYQERVIAHFSAFTDISNTTKEDWELLGQLFFDASERAEDAMEEFDKRILSKDEFACLYFDTEDWKPPEHPPHFTSSQDSIEQ